MEERLNEIEKLMNELRAAWARERLAPVNACLAAAELEMREQNYLGACAQYSLARDIARLLGEAELAAEITRKKQEAANAYHTWRTGIQID